MKSQRVDCCDCTEFIPPDFKANLFKMTSPAKCKLGKRVMFRLGKEDECYGGCFRYCDEFNDKINEK